VPADATATATNIMAHETLFRLGVAADLTTFVCAAPLAVILYALLRPVDTNVALLTAFLTLVQDAIRGINGLNLYGALELLGGADYLNVFSPEQRHAMVLLSLEAHSGGFGIALIFFRVACVLPGYLITLSGFVPRILGILMVIVGACYVINSVALILAPPVASMLFPWVLLPAFVGRCPLPCGSQ